MPEAPTVDTNTPPEQIVPNRDDSDRRALVDRTIVLDCRWLGMGGAGRITELLLKELVADPPGVGHWILWGRTDRIRDYLFPGARIEAFRRDPRAIFGQRAVPPRNDVALYMHQIRPLRRGRSVTFILDTIPLRYGGNPVARLAKRLFLISVARLSTVIITVSDFSRSCIERDLGIPESKIVVTRLPIDEERAARVVRLRSSLQQVERLLYVGRFDTHKNLRRLCLAFAESDFARRGGTLLLVGAWSGESRSLKRWVDRRGIASVELRPTCSEAELDRLFASSRALVLPSLEEGYGLPGFEAMASGLPVAATATGAMEELRQDGVLFFEPRDVGEMKAAIDSVTTRQSVQSPSRTRGANLRPVVLEALARCFRGR